MAQRGWRFVCGLVFAAGTMVGVSAVGQPCAAQQSLDKADRQFQATILDSQGVESELKQVRFYWEEKISDTSFIPHEIKEIPVKRGTATITVKFANIRQIEVRSHAGGEPPLLTITLMNGKTGEFALAIPGSIKGQSDFGEVDVPASGIAKLLLK
ncbi:MAG: conserved exported protein of unknown function [Nitrospira sp.]|nr:MAG: conserved exported protein of unknown function [Nitrospira sp.]